MDKLLELIDKIDIDKEDLGLPLAVGGSAFLVEAIFDLIIGVPPGTLGAVVGSITLGGKFLYNKFYSDEKKLGKAYEKLSAILKRNKQKDLSERLDKAYELFLGGFEEGKRALMNEIKSCINEYISRKEQPNKANSAGAKKLRC